MGDLRIELQAPVLRLAEITSTRYGYAIVASIIGHRREKTYFGVSNKVRLKPDCSSTESS